MHYNLAETPFTTEEDRSHVGQFIERSEIA